MGSGNAGRDRPVLKQGAGIFTIRQWRRIPGHPERRRKAGFTLVETLLTMLILALSSIGMASGVGLAAREYRKSMVLSETKVLTSSLTDSIRDVLSNATAIDVTDGRDKPKFFARDLKGGKCRLYARDGEIWVGDGTEDPRHNTRLLNSSAYSFYHLKASVGVTYDGGASPPYFRVNLVVQDTERPPSEGRFASSFDVFPLNP